MADRGKVAERLEKCERCECDDCTENDASHIPWDCPAYDNFIENAIILLKEQEAKTGKWIPIENTTGVEAFGVKEMTVIDVRCSVCGSEEDVSFTGYKYCPRCGAKMGGEAK